MPFSPVAGQTTHPKNRLWGRMVDPTTLQPLANTTEVLPENLMTEQAIWYSPPQAAGTKALIQISLNNHDWIDVKKPSSKYSFEYVSSPHLTELKPSFGQVKAVNTTYMTIEGSDFNCPDANCTDLTVRFGSEKTHSAIYVKAQRISATELRVVVPKYTKPDVL